MGDEACGALVVVVFCGLHKHKFHEGWIVFMGVVFFHGWETFVTPLVAAATQ